jgi:FkbM family methyltransferase
LKNIVAFDKAIPDKPGILKFHQYLGGRDAFSSFGNVMKYAAQSIVEVETTTLDIFMKTVNATNPPVSLIKIDVEGWEYPVLKGGLDYLSSPGAPALMVEFTEDNARKAGFNCRKVYDLGKELGYTWLEIHGNELRASSRKSYYDYQNLYAVKDVEMTMERWGQ